MEDKTLLIQQKILSVKFLIENETLRIWQLRSSMMALQVYCYTWLLRPQRISISFSIRTPSSMLVKSWKDCNIFWALFRGFKVSSVKFCKVEGFSPTFVKAELETCCSHTASFEERKINEEGGILREFSFYYKVNAINLQYVPADNRNPFFISA